MPFDPDDGGKYRDKVGEKDLVYEREDKRRALAPNKIENPNTLVIIDHFNKYAGITTSEYYDAEALDDWKGDDTVDFKRIESFRDHLHSHKKYDPSKKTNADYHLRVRRACKGGLDWVVRTQDCHVHFVLDGIDMKDVVEKTCKTKVTKDYPQGKGPAGDSGELTIVLILRRCRLKVSILFSANSKIRKSSAKNVDIEERRGFIAFQTV